MEFGSAKLLNKKTAKAVFIVSSGARTRTWDLRVMSPTSCHCSTPRRWLSERHYSMPYPSGQVELQIHEYPGIQALMVQLIVLVEIFMIHCG